MTSVLFCAVECHVLTSHGSAVAAVPGAQFLQKGRAAAAAAVTAIHASIVHVIRVTVVPVSVVIFQSGSGVALVPVQIAVEKSHAEVTVAISHLLHALIALAAYADAHVLNVQRYALVAVVQTSVVTLAIYVTSIFKQFHLEALFLNMTFYFKWNINFANMEGYKIVSSSAIINGWYQTDL